MKLTNVLLTLGLSLGTAWAQNPDVIDNTRNTLQNLQKKQTIDQNAALASSGQAHSAPAPAPAVKAQPAASKSAVTPAPAHAAAKPAVVQVKPASTAAVPAKTGKPAAKASKAATAKASKPATAKASKESTAIAVKEPPKPQPPVAVEDNKNAADAKDAKKDKPLNVAGRRDPFVSPVVNRSMVGSGCSTGKRCLAIDQINLQGIVKSQSGMLAVVVNAMNKAYFLRENDPVFNGYVVKITGDSILFKETIMDKMGKPFEREVTKKITTPAV